MESCDNCKFSAAETSGDVVHFPFMCRRFPPSYTRRIGQNGLDFVCAFPEVMHDDWCGEWVSAGRSIIQRGNGD